MPVLVGAVMVMAAVSGALTVVGRLGRLIIEGVAGAVVVLAGIGRAAARPAARAFSAAFTFTPPTSGHGGRPGGDGPRPKIAEPAVPTEAAMAMVKAALVPFADRGDPVIPRDINTLAALLSVPPPTDDFRAADMVRDCFAESGSGGAKSRVALAVAVHLGREFGGPRRLPLATARAWRLLSPEVFEAEMAAQLAAIREFISDWQRTQHTFLCLEFGEIELIELLFEAIDPGIHRDLMMAVMSFKVLSNRRLGILRRIPHRLRKTVRERGSHLPATAAYVQAMRQFLDELATTPGYTPIMETAAAMRDEVDKLAETLKPRQNVSPPAAGPLPAGDGQPLARIVPVKRSAAELAAAGSAPASAASAPEAPPAPAVPKAPPAQMIPVTPKAASALVTPPPAAPALPAKPVSGPGGPIAGPTFSARVRPRRIESPIGIAGGLKVPATLGVTAPVTSSGARPPLPAPLPPLVSTAPSLPAAAPAAVATPAPAPARPKAVVTGRITLPVPSLPLPPTPPQPRMVTPPSQAPSLPTAPVPTATVSTLTVVPKRRRLPITQATKRHAVLKVLRGDDAAVVAESLGISAAKVEDWVDRFIAAGAGALAAPRRKPKAALPSAEDLRAKLAEVLATAQMIERAMDSQLPRRPMLLAPPDKIAGHGSKRPRK